MSTTTRPIAPGITRVFRPAGHRMPVPTVYQAGTGWYAIVEGLTLGPVHTRQAAEELSLARQTQILAKLGSF